MAESISHYREMRCEESSFLRGAEAVTVSGRALKRGSLVAEDGWH